MLAKRILDLAASGVGLLVLAPLLALIGIVLKLESAGPVFFRQERVGQFGKLFRIHKFRTMMVDAEPKGLQITVSADPRVTRVGRFLRKHKLDELPQLIDVFVGDMSLVGPRPEVPRYVEYYPPDVKDIVLSVKPGITDRTSIDFRGESEILGRAADPHRAYIDEILPVKLKGYVDYVRTRSLLGDVRIILATLAAIVR